MDQRGLLTVLKNKQLYGKAPGHELVTSLVNNSKKVQKGSCFIAIKGQQFDGHSVLDQVIKDGAEMIIVETIPQTLDLTNVVCVKVESTFRTQAILANHYFNQPTTKLNLVAVTGTNGKTTTSTMISDLLMHLGHKTGLIGTLHYKVDQTYYPAVNTTPDAYRLQELFAEMVDVGCQDAVIEASSHALALGRISYTDVDCAIFTNLTREHLDFHQTMDNYACAKSLLFAHLGQSFKDGRPKLAIINADDPYGQVMGQATSAELASYSLEDSNASVYGHSIQHLDQGLEFTMVYQNQSYRVQLPMLGNYNVSNYLAAFLCLALYYELSVEEILAATKKFEGVTGRMQMVDEGQDYQVIVDFAHTPDALENLLKNLSETCKGRLVVMMGHSGGNRDSGMRPDLGDILFKYADWVVLTADNPRHEDVGKICNEMRRDHSEKDYHIIEDRHEAIQYIIDHAQTNDTIVFAGKGGEPYQVIGDDYLPFDEIEIVTNLIKKAKGDK